jgi:trk system potassium uptake protein
MTIDLRLVSRQLGLLMLVLTALLMAIALFAWTEFLLGDRRESVEPVVMLLAAGCGGAIGGVLFLLGRSGSHLIGQREAIVLVALSWLLGAAVSAMPFRLWAALRPDAETKPHIFDSYVDCYFEAMSGLTTTGATVVAELATLPRSLLLWRSLTQWLGGLGIVVLFVAVLPMLGVGSRRLFRHEATGPTPEGVTPRISDAARVLWYIYLGLTVGLAIVLRLCGMSWFDAVCHTFTTLSTGGFSTLDASVGGYPSTLIHVVIIVFMILGGVNFALYHQLLQGRWRRVLRDRELRAFMAIILVATVIISFSLWSSSRSRVNGSFQTIGSSPGLIVRDSLFQVVSIQTTTGFGTVDSDQWDFVAKATLVALMFIGGCAGSTAGGIKVIRIVIAFKVVLSELEHVYRPRVVRSVRVGTVPVDPALRLDTMVFLFGVVIMFAVGAVVLMVLESNQGIDVTTAITASAATLNNIGPGLARVGATQNYAWFSDASKLVMSLLMVLGRLELFTILVLFTPRFWRGE